MPPAETDDRDGIRFRPAEVVRRLQRDMERNTMRIRNGIKYVAGPERANVGLTPKDTVWTHQKLQLWRYRSSGRRFRPPVLLIMSLVSRSYIFDLQPGNSMVEFMLSRGLDVYLLDWGVPDHLEAENTLSTYCDDYMPRAVAAVAESSGSGAVTMLGYCAGGALALLYAAGHSGPQLRNLITMATAIDSKNTGALNNVIAEGRIEPESLIGEDGNVPASVLENTFRVLKPTQEIEAYVNLWDNLWNDKYVNAYSAMNGWGRDQIPFPGAAFVEMATTITRQNRLAAGVVPLGGREVRLADITCPVLAVLGEKDHVVPPEAARGLPNLVGSPDAQELAVSSGHVGLFVGKSAHKGTLPPLCDWIESRSETI